MQRCIKVRQYWNIFIKMQDEFDGIQKFHKISGIQQPFNPILNTWLCELMLGNEDDNQNEQRQFLGVVANPEAKLGQARLGGIRITFK